MNKYTIKYKTVPKIFDNIELIIVIFLMILGMVTEVVGYVYLRDSYWFFLILGISSVLSFISTVLGNYFTKVIGMIRSIAIIIVIAIWVNNYPEYSTLIRIPMIFMIVHGIRLVVNTVSLSDSNDEYECY